jgi:hypothetical protein
MEPDPVRQVAATPAPSPAFRHRRQRSDGWAIVIPAEAWAGGLAAALLIAAVAGLLPAIRAARLSPTEALWTV